MSVDVVANCDCCVRVVEVPHFEWALHTRVLKLDEHAEAVILNRGSVRSVDVESFSSSGNDNCVETVLKLIDSNALWPRFGGRGELWTSPWGTCSTSVFHQRQSQGLIPFSLRLCPQCGVRGTNRSTRICSRWRHEEESRVTRSQLLSVPSVLVYRNWGR